MRAFFILFFSLLCALVNGQTVLFNNGQTIHITEGTEMIVTDGDAVNESGNLENNGSLTIEGSLINHASASGFATDSEFIVHGNWENNASFSAGLSEVRLVGDNQEITGAALSSFHDLTLENTGVKSQTLDAVVNGSLQLNDVELATNENKMVVNNADPNAILFIEDAGFVSSTGQGRLVRRTNSTSSYVFPVGEVNQGLKYRPVTIAPSSDDAQRFEVRLSYADASVEGFNTSILNGEMASVNPFFFHHIRQTSGDAAAAVTIFYDESEEGFWSAIAGWKTNAWTDIQATNIGVSGGLNFVSKMDWQDDGNSPHILAELKEVDEGELYAIPNAFAPFGSQMENIEFGIINQNGLVQLESMQLYNRWGTKVFDSNSGKETWDGYYQGELQPAGSYTYLIELRTTAGEQLDPITGNVIMVW